MSIFLWSGLTLRNPALQPVLDLVLGGNVREATKVAQRLLESPRSPQQDEDDVADLASICADLMLAQDRDEEAEGLYRNAVRGAANAPRGRVRLTSCRSTAMTSLYYLRFGTAADSFRRLSDDPAATLAQRVQALGGLALASYGMGQVANAMQTLDDAAETIGETEGAEGHALSMFVSLLRVELAVRQEVRAHAALRDHVFWQAVHDGAASRGRPDNALSTVDLCMQAYGKHNMVAQRLRQWRAMLVAPCGDAVAKRALQDHLAWLRQAHLTAIERQERMETALVAIALRDVDMARHVMEPLGKPGEAGRERWNVEGSYCAAKVCELTGRDEESLRHYRRYALESVQCLRAEVQVKAAHDDNRIIKDSVEMSLPAKYRRAYRYLIDHLESAELTVREIAEHVNVTERALQSAFRQHLGMTPAEVLRRCRVERIRGELLSDGSGALTVIEAATRWGIRSRSTLVLSYRKYFAETPAETLSRRGEAMLA